MNKEDKEKGKEEVCETNIIDKKLVLWLKIWFMQP
jgi:hypothetical protein